MCYMCISSRKITNTLPKLRANHKYMCGEESTWIKEAEVNKLKHKLNFENVFFFFSVGCARARIISVVECVECCIMWCA